VPVKASDFFGKPTLKNLREKFGPNETARAPHKGRLRTTIDLALLDGRKDLAGLMESLRLSGIDMVIRQNAGGLVYGITYVDHVKKTVFNGSDLGKGYSAKAMLERCAQGGTNEGKNNIGETEKLEQGKAAQVGWHSVKPDQHFAGEGKNITGLRLLETLLEPEHQPEVMDWQLKRKRKKKKRQRLSPD
jgi:hypothetical protein